MDEKKARDKSFVYELSQLKREVRDEIKREIKEGLIEFCPSATGVQSVTHRKSKEYSNSIVAPKKELKPSPLSSTAQVKFTALRIGDAATQLERHN